MNHDVPWLRGAKPSHRSSSTSSPQKHLPSYRSSSYLLLSPPLLAEPPPRPAGMSWQSYFPSACPWQSEIGRTNTHPPLLPLYRPALACNPRPPSPIFHLLYARKPDILRTSPDQHTIPAFRIDRRRGEGGGTPRSIWEGESLPSPRRSLCRRLETCDGIILVFVV